MAKYKKRVEWGVRLQHYNLKEGDDLHPRAVLRGTLDVHDLALILEENSRGIYRAADTELIVNQLMSVARDALVDGYALNTPMGRLTPVVRGMWNFNRINPAARAQNRASLSYALSTVHQQQTSFEKDVTSGSKAFIVRAALHIAYIEDERAS